MSRTSRQTGSSPMNNSPLVAGLLALAALALSSPCVLAPAMAADEAEGRRLSAPEAHDSDPLVWAARVQAFTGRYDISTRREVDTGFEPPDPARFDDHTGYYGLATGLTIARGRYGVDMAVDFADIDRNDITELALRLVTTFGEHGTASVGYRAALQGDGFANDDSYRERGFLIGLGFRNLEVPWLSGSWVGSMAGSLTYNASELELPNGNTPDAKGLLAVIKMPLVRYPDYGLGLRYRRFDVDDVTVTGPLRVRDQLTESYLAGFVEYIFFW